MMPAYEIDHDARNESIKDSNCSRRRRFADRVRKDWYAVHRQQRFARFMGVNIRKECEYETVVV